jgi:hypothetical protein
MACEPLGINYLSQKKMFMKRAIWPLVNKFSGTSIESAAIEESAQINEYEKFNKIAIAIF